MIEVRGRLRASAGCGASSMNFNRIARCAAKRGFFPAAKPDLPRLLSAFAIETDVRRVSLARALVLAGVHS